MEWISVEDRLPEVLEDVIATDGSSIEIGFRSEVDDKDNLHNWCDFWFDVTHWMPLPDPPESETK